MRLQKEKCRDKTLYHADTFMKPGKYNEILRSNMKVRYKGVTCTFIHLDGVPSRQIATRLIRVF